MTTLTSRPPLSKDKRRARFLEFVRRVDPDVDPTGILLFRQVRHADNLLTRAAEKSLERAGLSWPKFMLLVVLYGNEAYGTGEGMQPSELSDLQGIPRNHVSMVLAALEEEGLISRELHGTDRRKRVICLTARGRKMLNAKLGPQFQHISQCFAAFSPEERATLSALLAQLSDSLSETNP